jgi:transposase
MGQSKYSLEFKKSCVDKILQDHLSVKALANELGLDRTMLYKWCRFYELHGTAGLQRRSNRLYDVKFKLKVLKTIATGKFSIKEAAVKFNIAAESNILNWQRNH